MRKRAERIIRLLRPAGGYNKYIPQIEAELTAAVNEYRSKVPPPDEIHRDGYNEGVKEEREKWEAIREAIDENAEDRCSLRDECGHGGTCCWGEECALFRLSLAALLTEVN